MRYLFILSAFVFWTTSVSAATLYIDPSTVSLNRGDAAKVAVRLDTDENISECVNAVDVVINYSESVIPVDISTGKSILPIWAQSPVINKENHTITFAGGIPNGYCGRVQGDPNLTNTLVEIVFRAPGLQVGGGSERSVANITFSDESSVYLNDGLGTKGQLATLGSTFAISDQIGSEILDPWRTDIRADDILPEEFSIDLVHDEKTFGGRYYIVFNTTDKQTGLSHYEVIEESQKQSGLFNFGAANAPWREVKSPYVLSDQTLNSVVRVKAIDKAGNEYIATLSPDSALRKSAINEWVIVAAVSGVFLLLLVLVVWRWLIKRRRFKAALLSEDSSLIK